MSDNAMMINLQAPIFNSEEKEWMEFTVKFHTFLVMKGCTETKSKLPAVEDEELDASTELEKLRNEQRRRMLWQWHL